MAAHREKRLLNAIIRLMGDATGSADLADRLQALLDETVQVFDADAAGIMLFARSGELKIAGSRGHHSGLLELLQVETGEGPCIEAAHSGRVVIVTDTTTVEARWPHFSRSATDAGYTSVASLPLRHRDHLLGSLNLFKEHPEPFQPDDIAAAQALADITTISILQQRSHDDGSTLQAQLQAALESRTVIEQAKGWLANKHGIDPDTAFALLRRHARNHQQPLAEAALGVLAQRITLHPGQDS